MPKAWFEGVGEFVMFQLLPSLCRALRAATKLWRGAALSACWPPQRVAQVVPFFFDLWRGFDRPAADCSLDESALVTSLFMASHASSEFAPHLENANPVG